MYKAIHKETSQTVAIKQFKESDEDEQVRKTAMREIRILKELKHDNIVNLIEVFRWKGKIFLVFEYVPHTLLEELENNSEGLAILEAKKYMWQLVRGTDFVHQHNVIHRDLKPENLLVSKHGVLKICDFGFARFLSGPESLYTDYVSTRWYRAPELLVGDANYGKGIDIWAIGCLLAELSTGKPLFPGESDLKTLQYILSTIGGQLTDKQKNILENNPIFTGMDSAIKSCCAPFQNVIDQRFPTIAAEIKDLLKQCLEIDPSLRPACKDLLEDKYFSGTIPQFEQELQEIIQKDVSEFQMRTKTGFPAPIAEVPLLKSINEDKEELPESPEDSSPEDIPAKNPSESFCARNPGKVNKVTITFPKSHVNEHTGSSTELNASFSKKSRKIPPGGGAVPSTMLLKEGSNPLKAVNSKRSFKEADFQNPPLFLKGDCGPKNGLPQLKGKGVVQQQNYPKVNKLVALPQIMESKGVIEKSYLKNVSPAKPDSMLLNSSFEYGVKQGAAPGLNDSVDENMNPTLFSTSIAGGSNKMLTGTKKEKCSMLPVIPPVGHAAGPGVTIYFLSKTKLARRNIQSTAKCEDY